MEEKKIITPDERKQKADMRMKEITDLQMHETVEIMTAGLNVDDNRWFITRVMSGWIYKPTTGNSVFVPEK